MLGGTERIAALPEADLNFAANQYLAELHALAPDKTRIVDKMPGNYFWTGIIPFIMPEHVAKTDPFKQITELVWP